MLKRSEDARQPTKKESMTGKNILGKIQSEKACIFPGYLYV